MDKEKFSAALAGFLAAAQAKVEAHNAQYRNLANVEKLDPREGPRYIKVVKVDTRVTHSGSAYCFIDKNTGDVLKAAGFNAPAKGIRSNIFAEDFGASGVDWHGAVYRR